MIQTKGTIMDASAMGKAGFGFKRRERHTKAKEKAIIKKANCGTCGKGNTPAYYSPEEEIGC